MKKRLIILIAILFAGSAGFAQVDTDSDLFKQLKKMDEEIFDKGFNLRDTAATRAAIHEDFEFYHDQSGIEDDKEEFLRTIQQNICNNPEGKPIRKLVEGSLQVFPLYNNGTLYGAILMGDFKFFFRESDGSMRFTTAAKFTSVWILTNGEWKLKRALSYDHG